MAASYRIVFEEGERNWSAYSPDVPGCIATGRTKAETERNFRSAVAFHREGLRERPARPKVASSRTKARPV